MTGSVLSKQPEAAWLAPLRERGRSDFEALGLPTKRLEAWRYFPTRALRGLPLATPVGQGGALDAAHVAAWDLPGSSACAVFIDGRFDAALSRTGGLPEGVVVSGLADAAVRHSARVQAHLGKVATTRDGMMAANEAAFTDGLFVDVPRGTVVEGPIVALDVRTGAVPRVATRDLILMGRTSQAIVVQRVVCVDAASTEETVTNTVAEVVLGDGAGLFQVRAQQESATAQHVAHLHGRVARDARWRAFTLSLGGRSARTSIRTELAGAGSHVELDGIYVGTGSQRLDHYTETDHLVPHGRSDQRYTGVMDGRSVGNYLGVVLIREGAKGSVANQLNRNLLLSEGAKANSKPQLEIDNDDVKASHGTTVGQLDQDALFYLVARGIPADQARALLTLAFARAAVSRLGDAAWTEPLAQAVADKLGGEWPTWREVPEAGSP